MVLTSATPLPAVALLPLPRSDRRRANLLLLPALLVGRPSGAPVVEETTVVVLALTTYEDRPAFVAVDGQVNLAVRRELRTDTVSVVPLSDRRRFKELTSVALVSGYA